MLDPGIPRPAQGRTFSAQRRVRLSDMDAHGRLRLDAVARFLQDIAIDDVQETGWGMPEHLWFVRRIRIDVLRPFLADREVELTTWCSGVAAIAAGRRWSVRGDAGGEIEVDSVWIHLDAAANPARIEDFGVYAEATQGRHVSTKLELPDPPADALRSPLGAARDRCRPPRAREQRRLLAGGRGALRRGARFAAPVQVELDYRQPIDLGEEIEVARFDDAVAFVAGGAVRAVARVSSGTTTG